MFSQPEWPYFDNYESDESDESYESDCSTCSTVRAVRQFMKILLFAIRTVRSELPEQSNSEHLLFGVRWTLLIKQFFKYKAIPFYHLVNRSWLFSTLYCWWLFWALASKIQTCGVRGFSKCQVVNDQSFQRQNWFCSIVKKNKLTTANGART